ncbi:MAG: hypothetical protein DKINENOH_04839 [bacterium]|nr:hypothetical protein [bacterium]
MTGTLSRARLRSRHRVSGKLVLDTALHLGGGRNPAKGTDSPIVRDGFGRPFIPGSSIKGAVRAAVERIVPNLQISACGLYDSEAACLTALPETDKRREDVRFLQEALGRNLEGEVEQKLNRLLRTAGMAISDLPNRRELREEHLLIVLDRHLCDVCKAFGSPFVSAAIFFHDAPVDHQRWLGITQVRDGVGIDRDSGRAVDGLKYDYEIVPPETAFTFAMTLEPHDALSLALAALALQELRNGNIPLGGIRSRGLGRCHLEESATVESLNLQDAEALRAYLTAKKTEPQPLEPFIAQHISALWTAQEGHHV